MKIHHEKVDVPFDGTIIDIESIGNFNNSYPDEDSRQYKELKPTIFGCITSTDLKILCAENESEIEKLNDLIKNETSTLPHPFHAFNVRFEQGIIYHSCGMKTPFEGEINTFSREKKKYTVEDMKINNYDDPFFDDGKLCVLNWPKGEHDLCIKHNRSCLLKERDILVQRGRRVPDKFTLI